MRWKKQKEGAIIMIREVLKMKKNALFVAMVLMLQIVPVFTAKGEEYPMENLKENVYNLNVGWKFKKANVSHPMAEAMASMVKDGKEF